MSRWSVHGRCQCVCNAVLRRGSRRPHGNFCEAVGSAHISNPSLASVVLLQPPSPMCRYFFFLFFPSVDDTRAERASCYLIRQSRGGDKNRLARLFRAGSRCRLGDTAECNDGRAYTISTRHATQISSRLARPPTRRLRYRDWRREKAPRVRGAEPRASAMPGPAECNPFERNSTWMLLGSLSDSAILSSLIGSQTAYLRPLIGSNRQHGGIRQYGVYRKQPGP